MIMMKEKKLNVIDTTDKNSEELDRFYEEINLLKMINSNNIIKYLNGWFESEKSQIVLISELFTGGSLIK